MRSADSGSDVDSTSGDFQLPSAKSDVSELIEPWVDWIRRSTREAEECIESLRIEDWISQQRLKKWRWLQRVASMPHGEWSRQAILWDPCLCPELRAHRRAGRPRTRWIDDISAFMSSRIDEVSHGEKNSFLNASESRHTTHVLIKLAAQETWNKYETLFVKNL